MLPKVTAIGYVLTALSGKYLLGETISAGPLGGHPAHYVRYHPGRFDQAGDDRGARTAMKWILVFILVTSTTLGDVARARGMKKHGEVREFHPGAISQALWALARNKWVILSTCAMAVSFFSLHSAGLHYSAEFRGAGVGGYADSRDDSGAAVPR